MQPRFIRRKALPEYTGLSIATLYRLIRQGKFPAPVKLSAQAVGWRLEDVSTWISSREATK